MVNVIDDIMQYYHFNFIAIYCLAIVILISTILSFKMQFNKGILFLYSIFSEIGLLSGMLFIGVLQDNNAPNISFWRNQLWILIFISIVGLLLQLIQLFRKKGSKKKKGM